ncbi:MAG TPA: GNAT family N-acetyltransferase [Candidatus Hydrogenedentes bacterium]|nr:GNAT family N-acetyltransferase [Candidatus Hydrogenedentota bacterium]
MEVVLLPHENYADVAALIARAFRDDPLTCFMLPDPATRRWSMEWIHTRWFRVVGALGGTFTTQGGGGVAVWWPPGGRDRITLWRIARAGLLWTPLRVGWAYTQRMREAYADVERHAEAFRAPHWYLDILAVDPASQGRGLGGALIRHVTERADRDRLPCYVVTHNLRNVPYYERFGFRLLRQTDLAPGLRTSSLEREPAR